MPACIACHCFDGHGRRCTVPEGSPIRKCVIAMLERECSRMRGRVLEIGCGSWDFARRRLEATGCEYHGIDPAPVNEKGQLSVATHRGTVGRVPFASDYFDHALGTQTLEHWNECKTSYGEGLGELHRVLKPGGRLSLNVPIHLHGHLMFVRGDVEGILRLFDPSLWIVDEYESWRQDYEPLEPFQGWRLNGFDDSVVANSRQRVPSSWILAVAARKRTRNEVA